MNALFKPLLIVSLLLLAGAGQYFAYASYIVPREKAAHDLQALTDVLQLEARRKPGYRAPDNRGVTIPDLLSRVQELAQQNGVTLAGVEPLPGDAEQFKLNLSAKYPNFLEFLARFETLQVAIAGLDVAPAMDAPDLLAISIRFGHTAVPNTIRPERIREFKARLEEVARADPFNPPTVAAMQAADDPDTDDLTWTFHLTSISEIGKTKYATIDGRDYNVGDKMQRFTVAAIGPRDVTLLETQNGKERQRIVKFRNARESRT